MVNRLWDKKKEYTEGFLKEYNHWVLEVSYRQHTLGCFIIFAKKSLEKISDLEKEELDELKNVMKDIEKTLSKIDTFKPDRINYLQMGNSLHHLHFHGIPRYSSPRSFDGKEWIDKTFGNPPVWSFDDVSHDLVRKIREVIRPNLFK